MASDQPRRLGHFELREVVGVGGFGAVWRAVDLELDRTVAVKIPRKGELTPREAEKFFGEARAAAQLQHPNIVSVHEVGREDDTVYIVTDFVEGLTLSDWLTGQTLTSREAAELCEKVAAALEHAHAKGVVHRDLKPGNIGLDADGEPHIMDFGLARRLTADVTMTADGKVLGTPAYMSPEQARGEASTADSRSDVYSLGVVLFELLTGEKPFRGNMRMLINQVLNEEPPSPARLNSSVPRDLETICLKCMEKEPGRRYQTATALREELARFRRGEPIAARPISSTERGVRWARRNPLPAGLALLCVVSLAAGLAGVSWKWREAASNLEAANDAEQRARRNEGIATRERNAAVEAQIAQQRQTSRLLFERAWRLCEEGESDKGLHWFVESLRRAPTEDEQWRQTIRSNISGWSRRTHRLLRQLETGNRVRALALSPDESILVIGEKTGLVRRFDPLTGQQLGSPLQIPTPERGWSGVLALAFGPEGDWFFAGSGGQSSEQINGMGRITRISTATGEVVGEPIPFHGPVTCICFSPDGTQYVCGTSISDETPNTGVIQVRRTSDDQPVTEMVEMPAGVESVAFTADGRIFAGLGFDEHNGLVASVDIATGTVTEHDWTDSKVSCVACSPGGETLAFGTEDHHVHLRTLPDLQVAAAPLSHPHSILRATFTPDGSALVTSCRDAITRFWDVTTGRVAGPPLRHTDNACIGPRLQLAVTSRDRELRIWRLARSESRNAVVADPRHDLAPIHANIPERTVAVSRDGKRLICGLRNGLARIVDVATGRVCGRPLRHPDRFYVRAVAFSPDGQLVATASQPTDTVECVVRIWDAETGEPRTSWLPQLNSTAVIAFSPNSRLLAVGDYASQVQLLDTHTGDPVGPVLTQRDIVLSLAFSPDGTKLAAGTALDWNHDPQAQLWDIASGVPIGNPMRHENYVVRLRFSPDGKTLLTGSTDSTLRLWSVETTEPISGPIPWSLTSGLAEFSPDGATILTGSVSGEVRLWDATTGQQVRDAVLPGLHQVTALAWSGNGKRFAVGYHDGTARLCDTATFAPIGPPVIQRSAIFAIHLSEDGDSWTTVQRQGIPAMWTAPQPAQGPAEQLAYRLQRHTGLQVDESQSVLPMTFEAYAEIPASDGHAEPLSIAAWRDHRLRDAFEDANLTTAVWHLDRQVVAQENDWWARARRGHAYLQRGDAKAALADYTVAADQHARQWAVDEKVDRSALACWEHDLALAALKAEAPETALWYLDRLCERDPERWDVHRDRADALEMLGRSEDGEAARAVALRLTQDDLFLSATADQFLAEGRFDDAVDAYARIHKDGVRSLSEAYAHALLLLRAQDEDGYRRMCRHALDLAEHFDGFWPQTNMAAWIVALGPSDPEHAQQAAALMQSLLSRVSDENTSLRNVLASTCGCVLCRVEEYDRSLELLNEVISTRGNAEPAEILFLAMATLHTGEQDDVRTLLAQFREAMRSANAGQNAWSQLELSVLAAQADALEAMLSSDTSME